MSDLLQQAIIDAAALKEAAIKNAENTLVEKYSQEFKDTVQKLLEQEDMSAQPVDPAAAAPPALDPAAAVATPTDAAMDPAAAESSETNKKDAFSKVTSAFLDGPDDELITINFDQIKSTMMEMMGHITEEELEEVEELDERDNFSGAAEPANPLDEVDPGAPLTEMDLELELDIKTDGEEEEEMDENATYSGEYEGKENLEEYELEENNLAAAEAAVNAAQAEKSPADASSGQKLADAQKNLAQERNADLKRQQAAAMSKQPTTPVEEEIELTEEELTELAEELRVDLNPEHQGRGYMGSTTVERQRLVDVERAAARDDEETKKREEEMERMADLVKENKQVKDLNNKMMSLLEGLKEEVQKINISNAKLLYTNKALGNISLNERQKNQIVESISKADSVLAAKTIYETLQNAVETASIPKEAPQALRETLNRAQSPFVVKKTAANSISDIMAERMKALAGIKK